MDKELEEQIAGVISALDLLNSAIYKMYKQLAFDENISKKHHIRALKDLVSIARYMIANIENEQDGK